MPAPAELYACDGCALQGSCLLEPFQPAFLGAEAWFLATAPLWWAEPDGAGGWRVRPQAGGPSWPLTQAASWCCRLWPAPAAADGPGRAWFAAGAAAELTLTTEA